MRILNATQKESMANAYSAAKFFLVVGPPIGAAVLLLYVEIVEGNGSDGIFVFLLFSYYFGAVPAFASGIVFGLTHEIFVHRGNKENRYLVVLITSVTGVATAIIFFWIHGLFYGLAILLVPLMAAISSVACSFLRFREIKNSGNK